jgi:hypothetical protein
LEDGDIESDGDNSIQKSLAFNLDQYRVYQQTDYSNLIELLESFSSSLCFEVRDKVYGLIGLAKDAVDFQIDYSRSLFDIFVDVIELQDKEYKRLRLSRLQGMTRYPENPVPWGQLKRPTTPPNFGINRSGDQVLRCFIESGGYVGVTACDIRASDTICQFQGSDVVAILRWQESASCYSLVGSAVFPKRRDEADTPFLMDSKESFQFSVLTSEECVVPISLWLGPYDLQRLTQ